MDPASPDQLKPQESATQEEIIVPQNIIRPLARGLFQLSSEPIGKIKEALSVEFDATDSERKQIDEIRQALDEITTTFTLLRTTKEVKIIKYSEKGGKEQYKLVFSPDTEPEEIPREGEISIEESLTYPLIIAVFDSLGNDLAKLGYAEILHARGESEELKEKIGSIYSVVEGLNRIWNPIQTANYKLKISTDGEGNTTIEPIPKPPPSAP